MADNQTIAVRFMTVAQFRKTFGPDNCSEVQEVIRDMDRYPGDYMAVLYPDGSLMVWSPDAWAHIEATLRQFEPPPHHPKPI